MCTPIFICNQFLENCRYIGGEKYDLATFSKWKILFSFYFYENRFVCKIIMVLNLKIHTNTQSSVPKQLDACIVGNSRSYMEKVVETWRKTAD